MNRKQRRANANPERAKRRLPIAELNGVTLQENVRRTVVEILGDEHTPEKAMDVAASAASWADQLIDDMRANTPKLGCAKGCSWCCYQSVSATVPEIFQIITLLAKTLDREQLGRAFARIIDTDDKTRDLTSKQRFRPELPCPLLENGSCTVYASRPLACRGMSSFSDEACKRALTDPAVRRTMVEQDATPLPAFRPHLEIAGSIARGQQAGLNGAGLMGYAVELNHGLRIAVEFGSRVMNAWVEGEPVFDAAVYREGAPQWFLDQFSSK